MTGHKQRWRERGKEGKKNERDQNSESPKPVSTPGKQFYDVEDSRWKKGREKKGEKGVRG